MHDDPNCEASERSESLPVRAARGSGGGKRKRQRDGRPKLRDPRLKWRGDTIMARVLDPKGSGKKVRISTKCRDEAAAVACANEYERRGTDPAYRSAHGWTLRRAIEDTLNYLANEAKCVPSTVERARRHFGEFLRVWQTDGSIPLSVISGSMMMDFRAKRLTEPGHGPDKKVQPTTVGRELTYMRLLLRRAIFRGVYALPLERVFQPGWSQASKGRSRYPTQEQAQRLVNDLPPAQAAAVAFMLGTGARRHEALMATRDSVHWETDPVLIAKGQLGVVRIFGTKTEHVRTIAFETAITEIGAPWIRHALQVAPGTSKLTPHLTKGALQQELYRRCRTLGFATMFSPNDFRRAFTQWHLKAGVGAENTAKLLRHTSTAMVAKHYGRIVDGATIGMLVARQVKAGVEGGASVAVPDLCASNRSNRPTGPQLDADSSEKAPIRGELRD